MVLLLGKFSKLETLNIMSAKVNSDVCALYAHIVRNTFCPILFCRIPVNLLGFFNMHAERFLTEFFFLMIGNISQSVSKINKMLLIQSFSQ